MIRRRALWALTAALLCVGGDLWGMKLPDPNMGERDVFLMRRLSLFAAGQLSLHHTREVRDPPSDFRVANIFDLTENNEVFISPFFIGDNIQRPPTMALNPATEHRYFIEANFTNRIYYFISYLKKFRSRAPYTFHADHRVHRCAAVDDLWHGVHLEIGSFRQNNCLQFALGGNGGLSGLLEGAINKGDADGAENYADDRHPAYYRRPDRNNLLRLKIALVSLTLAGSIASLAYALRLCLSKEFDASIPYALVGFTGIMIGSAVGFMTYLSL